MKSKCGQGKKEYTAYLQFKRGYYLLQFTSREVLKPIHLLAGKLRVLWSLQPAGDVVASLPGLPGKRPLPSPLLVQENRTWQDLQLSPDFSGTSPQRWFFSCTVVSFPCYGKALCTVNVDVVTCMNVLCLHSSSALPCRSSGAVS